MASKSPLTPVKRARHCGGSKTPSAPVKRRSFGGGSNAPSTPVKRGRLSGGPLDMYFGDCSAVFIAADDKTSCNNNDMLRSFYQVRGGWVSKQAWEDTTHIFGQSWAQVLEHHWQCKRCPFRIQSTVHCVSYDWIRACVMAKKRVPERYFRVDQENDTTIQLTLWKEATGDWTENGKWVYNDEKAKKAYQKKF